MMLTTRADKPHRQVPRVSVSRAECQQNIPQVPETGDDVPLPPVSAFHVHSRRKRAHLCRQEWRLVW